MKTCKPANSKKINLSSKVRCISITEINELSSSKFTISNHIHKKSFLNKCSLLESTPKPLSKLLTKSISPVARRQGKSIIHKSEVFNPELTQTLLSTKSELLKNKNQTSSKQNPPSFTRSYIERVRNKSGSCLEMDNKKLKISLNINVKDSGGSRLYYPNTPKICAYQSGDNFSIDLVAKIKEKFNAFKVSHMNLMKGLKAKNK